MADHPFSDDLELIRKCLSDGDGTSWEVFVKRYSGLIWSAIYKTFSAYDFQYAKEDMEDLFASVFLSLIDNDFHKLRQFRSENACTLSTWLTVVTARMTIDHMRKDRRHFFVESAIEGLDILDTIPDGRLGAERLCEDKQAREGIKKTLEVLTPQDRKIYDLLYNRGVSPEETARTLGLPVASVYSRKHRIIGKLKKNVQGM